MNAVIIITISVIIFFGISWIIFRLADYDRKRVIMWARKLIGFLFILSVLFFGVETIKDDTSINLHKTSSLWVVLFNLFCFVVIIIVNWTNTRLESGKIRRKFNRDYVERQGNMMLMLSMITGPVLTFYSIFNYIKHIN